MSGAVSIRALSEDVAGVVDPDHRGSGLLRDLGAAMYGEFRRRKLVGIRNYATSAHTRTQQMIASSGGRTTGILLGHIPARTQYRGIGHEFGSARIGSVVYYQPFRAAAPLGVSVPDRWADLIASIYSACDLERSVKNRNDGCDPTGSRGFDPRRGLASIRVGRGDEPLDRLLASEDVARAEVTYVDIPLAGHWSVDALDALARQGFVFGALLPGSSDSELLRLQRVAPTRIAPDRIQLASPEATSMLGQICDELAASRSA